VTKRTGETLEVLLRYAVRRICFGHCPNEQIELLNNKAECNDRDASSDPS
jgi:hypothetical protein